MHASIILEPGQPFRVSSLPSSKLVLTSACLTRGDSAQLRVTTLTVSVLVAKLRKDCDYQLLQLSLLRDDHTTIIALEGTVTVSGVYEFNEHDF